ncbi:MAG: radical SAM/SPASM domain-containing protein [Microgenomates group bacterium]
MAFTQIVYHPRIKKMAAWVLGSSIARNPFYLWLYKKYINCQIKKLEKAPLRLMVENTNLCYANCIFCPHKDMKRKTGIMDKKTFKKIVRQAKEMGIDELTLHGFGEPLLDKDFFTKVRVAKYFGIPLVRTNTNGMYLTKEKLKDVFESDLDEIYISFDAATEATFQTIRPGLNFHQVEKNILGLVNERKKRKSQKPRIYLSFVESKENAFETEQYLRKWKGLVDGISVSFLHNWAGKLKANEKKTPRDPCRLLWTDLVISWNGDIPLCCSDYEGRVILGNINQQTLKEIWFGEKLKKIRQFHLKGSFDKIDICRNCDLNCRRKLPWWRL